MDEITLDDKIYVSSKRAAEITGYAKDYVGQLCREGRVLARLVGRNWYVLETSIREHRFGGVPAHEDQNQQESETLLQDSQSETLLEGSEGSAWNSPKYVPETAPVFIPSLTIHTGKPEMPLSESSDVVKEMQSAWQDWFSRTNELEVSRETLLEKPEILAELPSEEPEKTPEVIQLHTMQEMQPVTLEKVSEVIEEQALEPEKSSHLERIKEEIAIPIHRVLPAQPQPAPIRQPLPRPVPVMDSVRYVPAQAPAPQAVRMNPAPVPSSRMRAIPTQAPQVRRPEQRREQVAMSQAVQQGRIIRERRVVAKKKPSVVLQAVLLSVAGVAIAIALIGSGQLDAFLTQGNVHSMPIQYLGGENTVNNSSK